MYKAINDLNRKKIRSSISVKDENGKLISDLELVRNRWKEYIEKQYNAENKPHRLNVEPATDMDDIGPCILEEEMATAIKELKNNKAEEIDEIPAELLKCIGNTAVKVFTHLCQKNYETGKWPADFLQTVIIPLEKKPNATECSDFRKQMPLRSQQNIYIDHFHVGDFFLPVPLMLRCRLLYLYLDENQTIVTIEGE